MANKPEVDPSGQIYTPMALRIYDLLVHHFCNRWTWRCPTDLLCQTYERHMASSEHHLDIGVGTGFFPARAATKTAAKSITLMDINENTLIVAERRVKANGYKGCVETINHSVFEPLPADSQLRGKFDSISMFYVLHCLPGKFPAKVEVATKNMAAGLTKGGVLYGVTVLGRAGNGHNWLGRMFMSSYNKRKIFGNMEDDEEGLREGLETVFEEVTIDIVGMVAIFVCKTPKEYTGQ